MSLDVFGSAFQASWWIFTKPQATAGVTLAINWYSSRVNTVAPQTVSQK